MRILKRLFLIAVVLLVIINTVAHATTYVAFGDKSRSMLENGKLKSAQEGLKLFVAMAGADDTLRIVSFDDVATVSPVFELRTEADRARCCEYIDSIKANGRTDYLSALRATEIPENAIGIFLSDGAHHGPADQVYQFIDDQLPSSVVLHTIAVGCPANSPPDQLLAEMAGRTDGSHSRVDSSEQLVQQFLRLGVQTGSYRGYQPTTRELRISRVSGRLLAFAYDGDVSTDSAVTRQHRALLPGEDVHMAVVDSKAIHDVHLKLDRATTGHARLGTVYVNDLPKHQLSIEKSQRFYSPGQVLGLALTFHDSSGNPTAANPKVSGLFELLDTDSNVIATVKPTLRGDALRASLKLPMTEGVFRLRSTSYWPRDGRPFAQTSEVTLIARKIPSPSVGNLVNPEGRTNSPEFELSKTKLEFKVVHDGIARFEIVVKPKSSHTGTTKLTGEYSAFTNSGQLMTNVIATVRWHKSNTIRGALGSTLIKGSILVPSEAGHFIGKLTVRTDSGARIDIPIALQVE